MKDSQITSQLTNALSVVLEYELDNIKENENPIPLKCNMYKWLSRPWKDCRKTLKTAKRKWRKDCKRKYHRTFRDYKARHKCYKEFYGPVRYLAEYNVKNLACMVYTNKKDQMICDRTVEAGKSTANLFANLRGMNKPKLDTPDPRVVSKTYNSHPQPQCRLDTYYQGALCDRPYDDYVSKYDPNKGYCNRHMDSIGTRPLCWYMPQ